MSWKRHSVLLGCAVITIVTALPRVAAAETVGYAVEFRGVEDSELLETLRQVSNLVSLLDKPPATMGGLRRRADGDGPRLAQALAARGNFGAEVNINIDTDVEPPKVVVSIDPGPVYTIDAFKVAFDGPHPAPDDIAFDRKASNVAPGMPARSSAITGATAPLLATLAEQGRPLAELTDRNVVLDHDTRTISVILTIDPGPPARFGHSRVIGLQDVSEIFVHERLPYADGDPYDARLLVRARRALLDTQLFSSVRVQHGEIVDAQGRLPITIEVAEAKQRTIGAGASYSTSEGPGGKIFWEHRNILGAGERLRAQASGNFLERRVSTTFRKPYFLHPDQTFIARVEGSQEAPEGFKREAVGATVGLERRLDDIHTATGGFGVEYSSIEDNGDKDQFVFLSLPMSVRRDTSDDLLNPTHGHRVNLSVTPFYDVRGHNTKFLVTRVDGSIYQKLDSEARFILAGRAAFGTITGEELLDIPADKRLYAGGGGSVRGYGFQLAGSLDAAEDPIGGRSLVEVGAELRIRLWEDFGIVPFVEGGRAFPDQLPDVQKGLLWSAGMGFRYFTGFGPIRLDVAVPLSRRGADAPFQFYVSIGQAF